MEATYNMGSDVDVCRMFDQYLYKRNENVDLSLSVPHSHVNGYTMSDQTFHTPSFGDEEFDIPPINPHQPQQQAMQPQPQPRLQDPQHSPNSNVLTYQQLHTQPSMGMNEYQPQQQQPQYQYSNQTTYMTPAANQMMMMPQQQQQQMMMQQQQQPPPPQQQGVYMRSSTGNSPPMGHETTTTSEDSDDSTPHPAMIAAMKRPSPEPVDGGGKAQKKPKVQKKKKKRDPNEPQKPVSAYALFFRDTQAAIKGQNPNASFGEVSKIVASMWDALDADSKNVYKKKTEAAKKDYLKALAIYRASIVSKGASESEGMYGQYGGYGGGYSGYSPPAGMPSPTNPPHMPPQQQHMQPQQQQMTTMAKKSPLLTNMMNERGQNGPSPQQGMMGSPMGSPMGHMAPQPHLQNQNSGYMQQMTPSPSIQHGNLNLNPSNGEDVNGPGAGGMGMDGGVTGNHCIRQGCTNPAITSTEWEDEYCSNECVVGHCRDVFNSWMASNRNQQQNHPAVK